MDPTDQLRAALRDLIITEMLHGDGAELTDTTELVDSAIVDSVNVLQIVDLVEEAHDIELEPEDIRQFTTLANIVRVVGAKLG